jgi:hypothetical protein
MEPAGKNSWNGLGNQKGLMNENGLLWGHHQSDHNRQDDWENLDVSKVNPSTLSAVQECERKSSRREPQCLLSRFKRALNLFLQYADNPGVEIQGTVSYSPQVEIAKSLNSDNGAVAAESSEHTAKRELGATMDYPFPLRGVACASALPTDLKTSKWNDTSFMRTLVVES